MAKLVREVVEDLQAILNPHTSNATVQLAYNGLETARTYLNYGGVPVINVKLSTPPTVVLDLIEEV